MQPALFLSHGAPTLALDDSATGRFLDRFFDGRDRPDWVLVASAHDTSERPVVGAALRPKTVHDFGGFADALYRIQYPSPGSPELARRVAALLQEHGVAARVDETRGLDHGTWVPLHRMLPEADVPVVTVSIQPGRNAAHHFSLGRAVRACRTQGALVLGSGGFVHNLGALEWSAAPGKRSDWAAEFASWMLDRIQSGDIEALLDWARRAPHARRAHPTPEHLLPLFFALGALQDGERLRPVHADTEFGSLAMEALLSSPQA